MSIWAIVVGSLILVGLFAGGVYAMSRDFGWRVALGVLAFAITLTAIVVGAALLISYGVGDLS